MNKNFKDRFVNESENLNYSTVLEESIELTLTPETNPEYFL